MRANGGFRRRERRVHTRVAVDDGGAIKPQDAGLDDRGDVGRDGEGEAARGSWFHVPGSGVVFRVRVQGSGFKVRRSVFRGCDATASTRAGGARNPEPGTTNPERRTRTWNTNVEPGTLNEERFAALVSRGDDIWRRLADVRLRIGRDDLTHAF